MVLGAKKTGISMPAIGLALKRTVYMTFYAMSK